MVHIVDACSSMYNETSEVLTHCDQGKDLCMLLIEKI